MHANISSAVTFAVATFAVSYFNHFFGVITATSKDVGSHSNRIDDHSLRCNNQMISSNHSIRHKHRKSMHNNDCTAANGDKSGNDVGSQNNVINKSSNVSEVFVTKNRTIITAQTGSTAVLPCLITSFVNGVVSWKRLKDYTLLTVGSTRYTASSRFVPELLKTPRIQHWRLYIKFVEHTDAGFYECQVSTYPPSHIRLQLLVTDAFADIVGSPELYIKNGSRMHLVCKFHQSTEEPSFVFWYHEENMINFEQERGVNTSKNKTGSSLTIRAINHSHSGNYTCFPSNIKPASIVVHILDDEKPAAMHTDNRSGVPPTARCRLLSPNLSCQISLLAYISAAAILTLSR